MTVQEMAAALAARDAGMASSAEHAEAVQPGWQDTAVDIAAAYLRLYCTMPVFTMEELRHLCMGWGLAPPPELRAWGAVTVRLIREGIIEKTGQFAPAASSHGSQKPLYRRKGSK